MKNLVLIISSIILCFNLSSQDFQLNELRYTDCSYRLVKPIQTDSNHDTISYLIPSTFLLHDTLSFVELELAFRFIKSISTFEQYDKNTGEILKNKVVLSKNNFSFPIYFWNKNTKKYHIESHFDITLEINHKLLIRSYKYFNTEIYLDSILVQIDLFPYIIGTRSFVSINQEEAKKIKMGEAFIVNEQYYKILFFDYIKKRIRIEKVSNSEGIYGYKEGKMIKNFSEIWSKGIDHSNIQLKKMNLFHFWGEWCQPCIKRIPQDILMYEKIDTAKVNIINVAFLINNKSKYKSEKIIKNFNITGYHFFDENDKFITPFHIESYPTMILVNDNGEIIYRSDSKLNIRDKRYLNLMRLLFKSKMLK